MIKISQEEKSIEVLKILGLIKNISKENKSQEFRLKEIDKIKKIISSRK